MPFFTKQTVKETRIKPFIGNLFLFFFQLRSIELFRNFPLEKFLDDKDAIMTKYFAYVFVFMTRSDDD